MVCGIRTGFHFGIVRMTMKFIGIIIIILRKANSPLTPQEIRAEIKENHTQFYGTASHRSNVAKGHYKDLDHALLAQIYGTVKNNKVFFCDKNYKPIKVSLRMDTPMQTLEPERETHEAQMKNEDRLASNIEYYYKRSLEVMKDFGGPSVYFHIQAIKEQEKSFLSDRHVEMIYATLASWGMHKMGNPDKTKAKMKGYSEFKKSILLHGDRLRTLSHVGMHSCDRKEYEGRIDELEVVYNDLEVSIAEATIVANSKTLAHILPNLIPPIDRQYTVRFFTQEYEDFFTGSGKFKPVTLPHGSRLNLRISRNTVWRLKDCLVGVIRPCLK